MKLGVWRRMGSSTKISAGAWLAEAKKRLQHSETPGLEAQLLLARVLSRPRASVLAHLDQDLNADQLAQLDGYLVRLEAGEPLPYLLGEQEFYGLKIKVNPGVLIPRPETELLVDTALNWLRGHPGKRRAVDIGAGSGCIAAALAAHIPDLRILAVDNSLAALHTAKENLSHLGLLERVQLVQSDLLTCIGTPFDLVCANLPYIPTEVLLGLSVACHEPLSALDGGVDGLDLIRRLLADARRWTAPGGLLLLEIEAGQAESAQALARQACEASQIEIATDLAGHARLLKIQR